MNAPFSPDADWQHAVRAMHSGQFGTAIAFANNALSRHESPEWLSLRCAALAMSGKAMDAVPGFRRLVELLPANPEHWSNLGNALLDAGEIQGAIVALQEALKIRPDVGNAVMALARAYRLASEPALALASARRACELLPDEIDARLLLASMCIWVDDWDQAIREMALLTLGQLTPPQVTELAELYLQVNRFDDAQRAFEHVLTRYPDWVPALLGRGLLAERVNQLAVAQQHAERAAVLMDDRVDDVMHGRLLQLKARLAFRAKDFAGAASILATLLQRAPSDPMVRAHLNFELGAALDQNRDYDRAWLAYSEAHSARTDHLKSGRGLRASTNDLVRLIDAPLPDRWSAGLQDYHDGASEPVFVIGFPRSGTTLLEQILDRQPALASFDEQPFLQRLILQLEGQGLAYPDCLLQIGAETECLLRSRYIDQVMTVLPDLGGRRPVDKNPLNSIRMPLAQRLFPGSCVILAVRHPCDVVLSCHMQSFRTPALEAAFATLETTAKLYCRMMEAWVRIQSDLQLPVLRNRYEDLVADPVGQTQKIASFLGLDWSESWLDSSGRALARGAIHTPSYAQVAEPMHTRSSGRWLRYRSHFSDDVMSDLAPWIDYFGYVHSGQGGIASD